MKPVKPEFRGVNYEPTTKDEERVASLVRDYIDAVPDRIEVHNKWPRSVRQRGLLFTGPPGTGKTLLATIVIRAMRARHYDARSIDFFDYIDRKQQMMDERLPADEWNKIRSELEEIDHGTEFGPVHYLLIDDVGKEYAGQTTWAAQSLFRLVRRRGSDLLPSMITTNLTVDQLEDAYGESFGSWLHGKFLIVETGVDDHRRQ